MNSRLTAACTALALATIPGTAKAAAEPQILERDGPWKIDYDLNSCHALAVFRSGNDQVSMRITKINVSEGFELGLTGAPFASKYRQYKLMLDFGLSAQPFEIEANAGMAGKTPVVVGTTRLDGWSAAYDPKMSEEQQQARADAAPTITPQQEAQISTLSLSLPNKQKLQLRLGSLGGPMANLRVCINGLVKSWGYDPAIINRLTRKPKPIDSSHWITTLDYPKLALARGDQAIVHFRLDVDQDGKTVGCTILLGTVPNELHEQTCKMLKLRSKFRPALDSTGNPVKSFFVSSVRWSMPG